MSEGSIALVKFFLSYKPNHPTIHLESSENISVPLRLPPPLHLFYHIGYLIVSVNLKFFYRQKLKCLIPPSPYAVEFSYAQVAFNLSHYCVMLIVVL